MSFLKRSLHALRLVGMTSLFFILFLFLFYSPVSAATNFTTDYTVTYRVSEDGITHATLNGMLTNTTSQYYATSYEMQLGFDKISNVKAADAGGPITPKVTKTDTGYTIALTFNKKAVGLSQTLPFTITFDTPTVAKHHGEIWEINIPGIANPGDFNTFTVTVAVPPSFGEQKYSKPGQTNKSLTFTKEQLGKSGISIAFGDKQLYSFQLTYHLNNSNIYPVTTEIALPPSTNYQTVWIRDISPRPQNVVEDHDGNWIAQYYLFPTQTKDIIVTGTAQVRLFPEQQLLSAADRRVYLQEQPVWQTNAPEIKELAKTLQTPQQIYNFVVRTLTYDFERVTDDKPRLGAVDSLKNPDSAVCREFADLFIALARAAGIPAREVNGFAYTENEKQRPLSLVQDILHAWPEYYDDAKKTWIMVDPTWGNTTGGVDYFSVLDTDHFAFVVKGYQSDYPVPAGGYKLFNGKNNKDISVNFAKTAPAQTTDASVTASFSQVIAGLPITGDVTITNTGTAKIPAQTISLISQDLSPEKQILTTKGIPPFGSQTWKVNFNSKPFLTNTKASFTVQFSPESKVTDKSYTQTFTILPFFLTIWGIGGITIGVLLIILGVVISKIRRVKL